MTDAIDKIIQDIIENREKGYSDRAADRGGPTKYSITLKTLSDWRGQNCTAEDVKNLSEAEAHEILRREFIERPGINLVEDPLLQELLADISVNAGPDRAIEFLQFALSVKPDGKFGPVTKAALEHTVDVGKVYLKVLKERAHHYARLMTVDQSQRENAGGWMNRIGEFIGKAAA